MANHDGLLRRLDVERRCGVTRSTICRLMDEDRFRRPIHVGPKAVRWLESDIDAWVASRPRATRGRRPPTDHLRVARRWRRPEGYFRSPANRLYSPPRPRVRRQPGTGPGKPDRSCATKKQTGLFATDTVGEFLDPLIRTRVFYRRRTPHKAGIRKWAHQGRTPRR